MPQSQFSAWILQLIFLTLNVWSPWFSKGSLSSPGDIPWKKIREESYPPEFWPLYLFQDTCKKGCRFISSDKLSQEACGRSEVTPARLHISSEFCSSASVEVSGTKSPNPGNGSATFQECLSMSFPRIFTYKPTLTTTVFSQAVFSSLSSLQSDSYFASAPWRILPHTDPFTWIQFLLLLPLMNI